MGQIEEEERPYMIVDKDSGRVYDMRIDRQVSRLTDYVTQRDGTQYVKGGSELIRSETSESQRSSRKTGTAWGDWWKEKKKSN